QGARHGLFHRGAHFAGNQLVFGLATELGLGHLYGQHAGEALAHVVATGVYFGFLGELVVGDVLVQHARHGGAQAGQVGAAIALRNIVGEAQHGFGVAVVPLHGNVYAHGGIANRGFGADREHIGVQHAFSAVDVFNEAFDATQERKVFFLAAAL